MTARGGLYKEPGEQHRGHGLKFAVTASINTGLTPQGLTWMTRNVPCGEIGSAKPPKTGRSILESTDRFSDLLLEKRHVALAMTHDFRKAVDQADDGRWLDTTKATIDHQINIVLENLSDFDRIVECL